MVTWACAEHLTHACERLQRDHEITPLVVQHYGKLVEWVDLDRSLRAIATTKETNGSGWA